MSAPLNILVIQGIHTIWTKASRGGAAASERNAVPAALSLSSVQAKGLPPLLEHFVIFYESSHFRDPVPARVISTSADLLVYGCLRLTRSRESLRLIWEYQDECGGAPRRSYRPKQLFVLQVGQWGRVEYNGRFSHDSGWSYRKNVLNVGLFSKISNNVFLETAPSCSWQSIVRLM